MRSGATVKTRLGSAVIRGRAFRLAQRALRLGLSGFVALAALTACQRNDAGTPDQKATQTFDSVCAKCHGADGRGGVPAMEGANPPRNFCDSAFQTSRTDDQLKQAIQKGKGGMPAFGNLFADADLQGLVSKIRSFDPAKRH
ncbi:MAG: cytochrome c [Pseudomonadota bacterium]